MCTCGGPSGRTAAPRSSDDLRQTALNAGRRAPGPQLHTAQACRIAERSRPTAARCRCGLETSMVSGVPRMRGDDLLHVGLPSRPDDGVRGPARGA